MQWINSLSQLRGRSHQLLGKGVEVESFIFKGGHRSKCSGNFFIEGMVQELSRQLIFLYSSTHLNPNYLKSNDNLY